MSYNKYFNLQLLKDSLKMINPVIITLIGAIILTGAYTYYWYAPGTTDVPPQINVVPAPENPTSNPVASASAAFANAAIFVLITLIGGLIFIFFIKYGLSKLMEFIFALIFAASGAIFSLSVLPPIIIPFLNDLVLPFTPDFVTSFLVENFINLMFLLASIIGLIYFLGLTVFKNQYLHNTLMIYYGMALGCIFGIFFEPISLVVVLAALALYDIYAVFRGPLKNMFDRLDYKTELSESNSTNTADNPPTDSENITTQSVESNYTNQENTTEAKNTQTTKVRIPRKVKNPQVSNGFTLPVYATPYITIGLGDFAFFSILIAKATFFALKGNFLFLPEATYGHVLWLLILLPFIGLLIGCYGTFVLLQKYEILPALPLPISGGLIGLFIAFLLQLL